MNEEDEATLDHGLIEMQKGLDKCSPDHIVDYLLLNSWIEDVPERDDQWKRKRMSELIEYQSTRKSASTRSNGTFDRISSIEYQQIEDILSCLGSIRIKSRSLVASRASFTRSPAWSPQVTKAMARLGSLRDRQTKESTMSYISYIDSALNRALSAGKDMSPSPVPLLGDVFHQSFDCRLSIGPIQEEDSKDLYSSDGNGDDEKNGYEDRKKTPQTTIKRSATDEEISGHMISVPRFRAIMSHSSKEYNVEEIIDDLKDDDTGHIPLDQIPLYTKRVQTLRTGNPLSGILSE